MGMSFFAYVVTRSNYKKNTLSHYGYSRSQLLGLSSYSFMTFIHLIILYLTINKGTDGRLTANKHSLPVNQ